MTAATMVLAADPVPARAQMAASLGFHIIFSCLGIALPAIVLTVHWIGLRRGDAVALLLARRWSRVMTVIFAVGAVSGLVLSYELGLLWPGLMGTFGPAFGLPFSVEGIWFFVEAIFTAIYAYGWRRLPPWPHWWTGTPMVVSSLLGALAVVAANAWMNQPAGFTLRNGRITDVDPLAVFFNGATRFEVPHMVLAAYMVTGFLVAGVYATGMLRGRWDRYHRLGFAVPFVFASAAAPVQILVGDYAAREVARQQPIKFAAMELVDRTHSGVTEWLGGVYYRGHVYFGVGVPWLDSLLVSFRPGARVIGWDTVPPAMRPPLANMIHLCFDVMVGMGLGLVALGAWQLWAWRFRRTLLRTRWFLVPAALSGLGAILAMECGWVVTEVGRQPWVVYGVQLTKDAVTPSSGVPVTLAVILCVYGVLTFIVAGLPLLMSRRWRAETTERAEGTARGPAPGEVPS